MKTRLVGELQAAIKQGGPVNAIQVCNTKAYEISASLSKDGITIGRTSHKLRNDKNQPKPWIKKYLDQYQGLTKAEIDKRGMAMKINEKLPGGVNGYLEPLFTQAMCLNCHGSQMAPDVDAKIKALYPKDQARGFKEGEFRGFVWVESK